MGWKSIRMHVVREYFYVFFFNFLFYMNQSIIEVIGNACNMHKFVQTRNRNVILKFLFYKTFNNGNMYQLLDIILHFPYNRMLQCNTNTLYGYLMFQNKF